MSSAKYCKAKHPTLTLAFWSLGCCRGRTLTTTRNMHWLATMREAFSHWLREVISHTRPAVIRLGLIQPLREPKTWSCGSPQTSSRVCITSPLGYVGRLDARNNS